MKNHFVNESQDLALQVSKYMEFNQTFAFQREELFSNFLEDFGKVTDQNSSFGLEKERMIKEVVYGCLLQNLNKKSLWGQRKSLKKWFQQWTTVRGCVVLSKISQVFQQTNK